jgi:hypothetical protein
MTELEVQGRTTLQCAGGLLQFDAEGRVTVSAAGVPQVEKFIPELSLSNCVEVWCGEDLACFVGEKGRTVWCARPSVGQLFKVLDLDRLDLRGAYDPGGLHRVEFQELEDGDLLVVHELGIARIGRDGSPCWQQVHDQLTAHFAGIEGGAAWLRGECDRFGFDLQDGHPVISLR